MSFLNLFRRHVVRTADISLCILRLLREHSREAEIAQLDIISPIKEDIARLDVSVKNLPHRVALLLAVTHIQCLQQLCEYFPNHVLCHEVLFLPTLLNKFGHVPILTVFHNDVDLP